MFIIGAIQHVKIGDLTSSHGAALYHDAPGEDFAMSDSLVPLPAGIEDGEKSGFNRSEEAALTRASTAGFAGQFEATCRVGNS